ncbi:helix-turn-helix domain-containing protein [Paenibacillus chitinolyticus]|uniref:helix-turn-helix domain-containing protein n=1 Tax=Paenibacillus chitinolyticus TaxID=79263 RepID=UPI0035566C9D
MRNITPSSLAFHLLSLERIEANEKAKQFSINSFGLIAVVQGSLLSEDRNQKLTMTAGEVVVFNPTTEVFVHGENCTYYFISYQVFQPNAKEMSNPFFHFNSKEHSPAKVKIPIRSLTRGLEQMYRHAWSTDVLQQCTNHMYFQEWMTLILTEQLKQTNQEHNSVQAVEQIIAYIHAFYYEELTVEQLAIKAGTSRRQFTHVFQKLTNRSVTQYVTNIRIEEAKKLLVQNETLASIAKVVGYQDEYYFSRRFKQVVGKSPRQYAKLKKDGVKAVKLPVIPQRIVADQYMGQLLCLGIAPIGARTDMLNKDYIAPLQSTSTLLHQTIDLGKDFFISPSRIVQLQPDLIITQNEANYKTFGSIAPTVVIPYPHTSPLTKLRLIGEAVGKLKQAEQWIARYEYRVERIRSQMISRLGTSLSVTNLLLLTNKLYVLGPYAGYGSYSLYQALQLQSPAKQHKELTELSLSAEIPISNLPEYVGDHIFLSAYGDTSILTENEAWKELSTVQKGNVTFCNPYRFAFEDPYSLDEQLTTIKRALLI